MSRRQVLMSLERLYSVVLEAEQLRRTQPIPLSEKTADSASHDIEHWCVVMLPAKRPLMILYIMLKIASPFSQ